LALDHPLHRLIGEIVSQVHVTNAEVVLDMACGGQQKVQLFCSEERSFQSCLCHVDAAILFNDRLKVIIEIEESDIRPVHLCGKVFVTALATHFIHRTKCRQMADNVSFIQVIDTSNKSENASKLPQCRFLESRIQNLLHSASINMRYDIFYGGIAQFQGIEDQTELLEHIRHALAN
jgi:trans-aconitate methyltransferase